jgi:hypothetical protein
MVMQNKTDLHLCVRCKTQKSKSEFSKDSRYLAGVSSWCKRCGLDRKIEKRKANPKNGNRREVNDEKLLCCSCGDWKQIEHFYRSSLSSVGRSSYCKDCERNKAISFRILQPEQYKAIKDRNAAKRKYQQKNRTLTKNYGISLDKYMALLSSQNGGCAICHATESDCGRQLCVDHDHASKKIRGLLCGNCNRAIGYLKDSVERIQAAAEYLKKH